MARAAYAGTFSLFPSRVSLSRIGSEFTSPFKVNPLLAQSREDRVSLGRSEEGEGIVRIAGIARDVI